MISPCRLGVFRFSSSASITAKTYAKFQEKYQANLQSFQKKVNDGERDSHSIKRSTRKIFEHPVHNQHRPITIKPLKKLQLHLQFMGGQQVSPHYENFGMARRDALVFWGGFFIMKFIAETPDFSHFADASLGAWAFTWSYLYFWTEGKKSFAMPILGRFYKKISTMQMTNLESYYAENVEVKVRRLMNVAKSQIQYKLVHNDYITIRNNTLLNFLINEQVAIKNHLNERALSILKQAEAIEEMNQNKIISSVVAETLSSIDRAYDENKEHIERQIFNLALEGIASGKMDYAKDPILPFIVSTIQKTVDKFNNISVEDQNKLVKLTADQLESIRNSDVRMRDEFLKNEPKVDGTLKANQIVGKILERWGK